MLEHGITHCIINADTTLSGLEDPVVQQYAAERLRTFAQHEDAELVFLTSQPLTKPAPKRSDSAESQPLNYAPSYVRPRRPIMGSDTAALADSVYRAGLFLDAPAPVDQFVYVSGENEKDASDMLRRVRSTRVSERMLYFCLTPEALQAEYDEREKKLRLELEARLAGEDALRMSDAPQEARAL